jgi:hypothetical protein
LPHDKAPGLPSTRSEPPRSAARELATALGLGVIAGLACSLPATLRVSDRVAATEPASRIWLGLATSALAPMVCAILVLRGAREGLRAFSGPGARIRGLGAGVALSGLIVGLSLFGSILRAVTHNRALAGVTFAMVGLVLVVSAAAASGRVVVLLEKAPPRCRAVAGFAIVLAVGAALAWTGLRFASVAGRDPTSPGSAGLVVDVLAFALAALFAARPSFAQRRSLAFAGPALAVLIAFWGLSVLRDPVVRAAIEERAPAFAPVADLVPST